MRDHFYTLLTVSLFAFSKCKWVSQWECKVKCKSKKPTNKLFQCGNSNNTIFTKWLETCGCVASSYTTWSRLCISIRMNGFSKWIFPSSTHNSSQISGITLTWVLTWQHMFLWKNEVNSMLIISGAVKAKACFVFFVPNRSRFILNIMDEFQCLTGGRCSWRLEVKHLQTRQHVQYT